MNSEMDGMLGLDISCLSTKSPENLQKADAGPSSGTVSNV